MSIDPHSLVLTPNAPDGIDQELVGQGSGTGIFTLDWEPPIVQYEEEYADTADGEGGQLVHSRPTNPAGKWSGRVIGSDGASHWALVKQLEETLEMCRGRYGGSLTWTPPDDTDPVTFDVESAALSGLPNVRDMSMWRSTPEANFTFRPFGELPQQSNYPISDLDEFNWDTLTPGNWLFDAGGGTLLVQSGVLLPTSTANKVLYRPINLGDGATTYMKFTTGAAVTASWQSYLVQKRLDANNWLAAGPGVTPNQLSIFKKDAGVTTSLGVPVALPAWVANTPYWVSMNVNGNTITVKLYTTDPNGANPTAAVGTMIYVLAGADAVKFGAGVKGNPGLYLLPKATDWAYASWRADAPWIEAAAPRVRAAILDVPGSAEAKMTVNVQDQASQQRQHVEVSVDDKDYERSAPLPTLLNSNVLQPVGGAVGGARAGAYDPTASGVSVVTGILATSQTAICSTGPQLHTGPRKIKARLYPNGTGPVYVRLAYRIGDGAWSRKPWVLVPGVNNYYEPDLGTITLPAALVAGQGWEGRIEAYSATNGDTLDVDYIEILPARRWGRAKGESDVGVLSYLIQERFNQGGGTDLNGAAVGGAPVQTSGWKNSAAVTDDASIGTVAWANPGLAQTANGFEASFNGGYAGSSHYLKAVNFGFAIPATATITGIVAAVKARAFGAGGVVTTVKTYKAGVIGGTNKAGGGVGIDGSSRYHNFGSYTDLWGRAWVPADINAATFGFGMSCVGIVNVDHVRMLVQYTDSAGLTWVVSGAAAAITVESTGHTAQRTQVSDADSLSGRFATAGNGTYPEVGVAVTVKKTDQAAGAGETFRGGALARYTDANNWLMAVCDVDYSSVPFNRIAVWRKAAGFNGGVATRLGYFDWVGSLSGGRRIWLVVDAAGNYWVWSGVGNMPGLVLVGNDASLVTGAALQTGKVGFYDAKAGALAATRNYDDVEVWTPDFPSPVIDSNGELHIGDDAVYRDSGAMPLYDGAYMQVGHAGQERRAALLFAKARRKDVDTLPDDQIADLTRLSVDLTPRVQLL